MTFNREFLNDLTGGGFMLLAGLGLTVYARKWPHKITGLTVKQFKWFCAVIIVSGAIITVWAFFD